MYRILVCDDEENLRKLIEKFAQFEGHKVIEAKNGLEAIKIVKTERIDIIVMDVMMPELDGFSTVKEIRKYKDTPVIMLSARGEEYDRIHGFEVGVDDYVVKPFSPKELMMRIEAIMKREKNEKKNGKHTTYENKDLKIDFSARKVLIKNKEIELAPKEYDLLFYLVRHKGLAVSRENLLSDVWGYDFYGDDRTLDTHIKLLRKHLGNEARHIVTLRGIGYRFEE